MIRMLLTALALTLAAAGLAGAQDAARLQALAGELRTEALDRAGTLAGAPGAASAPADPYDPFVTGVEAFAAQAMTLSRHIEAVGGPQDLKCIFRGMSEDAGARLETLFEPARAAQRAQTYTAYADLFETAEIIAGDTETRALAALPCPASAG